MSVRVLGEACAEIVAAVSRAVVGKEEAIRLVLACLLADGHVLIEDVPGVAKTLLARSLAAVLGLRFSRIQFTPDLLPADITGGAILDPHSGRPTFRPGPIFAHVVLADEINRATPKTQAAMLEAMEERGVTVEGETHPLEPPFHVIATQNPVEFEGTHPLPEAQLDRFMARVRLGYPDRARELEILARRRERREDRVELAPVVSRHEYLALQRALEDVYVAAEVEAYIVDLVRATRGHPQLELGASPRATLALWKLARARAAMAGRDYVLPDDVKAVAVPALAHRVVVKPDLWMHRLDAERVVAAIVEAVPVPGMEDA